jgi:ABC-type glycerol-3-phosphate transport system permease component
VSATVTGPPTTRHQRLAPGVRTRRVAGSVVKYVSLTVAALCATIPLIVFLFLSLKTNAETNTTSPLSPPRQLDFSNYATAFTKAQMPLAFMNTIIIMVVSIACTIVIGSMTAYAIARFDFRGKRLVLGAFLVATLVPTITTQVATFQIVRAFGLVGTRGAPIILYLGTDIISIYIFLQFIRSIPISLDEAARLEGAGHFRIYWMIILPLLRPAIATVTIIKAVAIYNDFYTPFLYLSGNQHLAVVSTALFTFKGPFGTQYNVLSAAAILIILPVLVLFLFLQKYIYNGFANGAVK